MARDSKTEVAAVNLRIPSVKRRNYAALLQLLYDQRTPIQIYGDSHLVITHFDPESNLGVFSKYTEIEIDGNWFDIEKLGEASPEDVGKIAIPAKLKPNFSQFYFTLDEKLHAVAFEVYSDSKSLSLKGVARYFEKSLAEKAVRDQFGRVESTIVSSYQGARKLLQLPDIKEVRIIIRRPNSDDISDDLAAVMEERLSQQNADEYEEILKAKGPEALKPNSRTKELATVAAENGDVVVQSVVNGVRTRHRSSDTPLKEMQKHKADEAALPLFYSLAKRIFNKMRTARA